MGSFRILVAKIYTFISICSSTLIYWPILYEFLNWVLQDKVTLFLSRFNYEADDFKINKKNEQYDRRYLISRSNIK